MPFLMNSRDQNFQQELENLRLLRYESGQDVEASVALILKTVRQKGIGAIIEYTAQFDHLELTPETIAVSKDEISEACRKVPGEMMQALQLAADRIQAYHLRQMPQDAEWIDETGMTLGWKWTSIDRVGLYVPGGLASYPSSVLMSALPARVAGVHQLVLCVPAPSGVLNPLVLAAASLSGIDQIYRIGGAQAIAAMAFGAHPIQAVDKIVGPGNAWVAAAKRQVFGYTGIDTIAGPSEILIIADQTARPEWIAADLLSQAEHDPLAQSILVTDSAALLRNVERQIQEILPRLDRQAIARSSWDRYGALILVENMDQATMVSNHLAPEHLELYVRDPKDLLPLIRHAGAIFMGPWTPEAIGDYTGGPSHVLPTARSARFSSGLSVLDFMKRTSLSMGTSAALASLGPATALLAHSEQLQAHALSIKTRLDQAKEPD